MDFTVGSGVSGDYFVNSLNFGDQYLCFILPRIQDLCGSYTRFKIDGDAF